MAQKKNEANWTSQLGTYALMLGVVIFLVGASLAFFTHSPEGTAVSTVLFILAIALLLAGVLRAWLERKGEIISGERVRLVKRAANDYSWSFSFVVLVVLYLVHLFKLVALDVDGVLFMMVLAMTCSQVFFWFYFSKKEDLK